MSQTRMDLNGLLALIALCGVGCAAAPETELSSHREGNVAGPDATADGEGTALGDPGRNDGRSDDPQSMVSILSRSAALIDATVLDVDYQYDPSEGPRTVVTLAVEQVLQGHLEGAEVQLRMFGGPTPKRRFIRTSLSVDFYPGERYLLFLRNDDWYYSPLAADALEVEEMDGHQVLTFQDGLLNRVSPDGLGYAPRPGRVEAGEAASGPTSGRSAAALDISEFAELVAQAIEVEGIPMDHPFTPQPEHREGYWAIQKTAPAGDEPPSTSAR